MEYKLNIEVSKFRCARIHDPRIDDPRIHDKQRKFMKSIANISQSLLPILSVVADLIDVEYAAENSSTVFSSSDEVIPLKT